MKKDDAGSCSLWGNIKLGKSENRGWRQDQQEQRIWGDDPLLMSALSSVERMRIRGTRLGLLAISRAGHFSNSSRIVRASSLPPKIRSSQSRPQISHPPTTTGRVSTRQAVSHVLPPFHFIPFVRPSLRPGEEVVWHSRLSTSRARLIVRLRHVVSRCRASEKNAPPPCLPLPYPGRGTRQFREPAAEKPSSFIGRVMEDRRFLSCIFRETGVGWGLPGKERRTRHAALTDTGKVRTRHNTGVFPCSLGGRGPISLSLTGCPPQSPQG